MLEWYSRKQRHVTRNTWSSELFAIVNATDFLLLLGSLYCEIDHGVSKSGSELLLLRQGDYFPLPPRVVTDGMSLLTAVENVVPKVPTEASSCATFSG